MEPDRVPDVAERRAGRRVARVGGREALHRPRVQHLSSSRRAGPRPDARRACSGSTVTLQGGRTIVADEAYIRESILNPRAKIAAGYQPIMPTFQGLVSEEQLLELIEYVKSLKSTPRSPRPARPRAAAPRPPRRMTRRRRSDRGQELTHGQPPASPAAPLPERRLRHQVVAADARPQAHRPALPRRDHGLLLHRRRVRRPDPAGARHAARRSGVRRDLQQAVHDARRDDGVLLPDPVDSGHARQLPRADHDRREGSRVSRS